MKIGILETDRLPDDIITFYGSYSQMFQRLLKKINNSLVFHTYDVQGFSYPDEIDECDAYLITGSDASVYENIEWIECLKDFVLTLDKRTKKCIGVCFGHQLIAHALGGATEKSEKGWGLSVTSANVYLDLIWMNPPATAFSLFLSHEDQVVKLPEKTKVLAGNEFCPISMFQIGNHFLGIQGHPEFNMEYARYLVDKRVNMIGKHSKETSLISLANPVDNLKIAEWMLKFLEQKQ